MISARWVLAFIYLLLPAGSARMAEAATLLCKDPSAVSTFYNEWTEFPKLGCPLTLEYEHQDGDALVQEFEHGEVVWTRRTSSGGTPSSFVVIAHTDYVDSGTGTQRYPVAIRVFWRGLQPYDYDFFQVRVHRNGEYVNQWEISKGPRSSGELTINLPHRYSESGWYRIVVQGCVEPSGLRGTRCRQGWSMPLWLPYNHVDYSDIPPATGANNQQNRQRRAEKAFDYLCRNSKQLEDFDNDGSYFTMVAIAKLEMDATGQCERDVSDKNEETRFDTTAAATHYVVESASCPQLPPTPLGSSLLTNRMLVNMALLGAKNSRNVGSDFDEHSAGCSTGETVGGVVGGAVGFVSGIPLAAPFTGAAQGAATGSAIGARIGCSATANCVRRGDYDMTLAGLIPLMFKFWDRMPANSPLCEATVDHVLDNLLMVGGGQVVTKYTAPCATVTMETEETENHIWMTETSRYLANILVAQRLRRQNKPVPPVIKNEQNGLKEWIIARLSSVLLQDFYEFNARPYQRLTVASIENLYNFSDDGDVKRAAQNVLDYIAARFATSSDQLRRLAPFRRRAERYSEGGLFSAHSDELVWRFLVLEGNSALLNESRHGRVHPWDAEGLMRAAYSSYTVPEVISNLLQTPSLNPFWQTIRHTGVEVYAHSGSFLVSGGGLDVPHNKVVSGSPGVKDFAEDFLADENASIVPITLIPAGFGYQNRSQLIRIEGARYIKNRNNDCVAPGFGCGFNVVLPPLHEECTWVGAEQPSDPAFPDLKYWTFVNFRGEQGDPGSKCPLSGNFYVAIYARPCPLPSEGIYRPYECPENNFGFFSAEVVPEDVRFEDFRKTILQRNGTTNYTLRANSYVRFDERQIIFIPAPASQWNFGIISFTPPPALRRPVFLPTVDMQTWPLAHSFTLPGMTTEVIESHADAHGPIACVTVTNEFM